LLQSNGKPNRRFVQGVLLLLVAVFAIGCARVEDGKSNYAGITVEDNIAYIAYGPEVIAIDVQEQNVLWQYPIGDARSTAKYYGAPSIEGTTLAFADYGVRNGFISPKSVASAYLLQNIDTSSPSLVWQKEDVAQDRVIAPVHLEDGKVYLGTADNDLVILDAEANGVELWRTSTENSIWAEPAVDGSIVVVASMDKTLHAYDVDEQVELWKIELEGAIPYEPLIVDDAVLIGGFAENFQSLDLDTGTENWSVDATGWIWGSAVLDDAEATAYFADENGIVTAVDIATGSTNWQYTPIENELGTYAHASLSISDGMIFVPYVHGTSYENEQVGSVVALDASTGKQNWRQQYPMGVFSTPTMAGEDLVVLQQSDIDTFQLLSVNPENGSQRWTFDTETAGE